MENEYKVYVQTRKSKNGNLYTGLFVDLGYSTRSLCIDRATISEISGLPMREVGEIPEGSKIELGKLILK